MSYIVIFGIIMDVISFMAVLIICWRYIRLKNQKENEYYTDYVHNNLILRVYKPEFEFQAIGSIDRDKLLDRGNFSQFYVWALIQK